MTEFKTKLDELRIKFSIMKDVGANFPATVNAVKLNSANVNSCRIIHNVYWRFKNMADIFEHANEMYVAPAGDTVFVNFFTQRTPQTRVLMIVVEIHDAGGLGIQYLKQLIVWAQKYNITVKH